MTSKPWEKYQAAASGKGGPWEKYQNPTGSAPVGDEGPGAGQAALESFGNSATLGYLPQIQALASNLFPDPNRELDEKLKAEGFNIAQDRPDYIRERDANLARQKALSEEHPVASGIGTVGGALATGIATAGAMGPAATVLGRMGQAAKVGAGLGAAANPGDIEGELQMFQPYERMQNAATGAALGALLQGGTEGAGKLARKGADYYRLKANEKAAKVLGNLSEFEKAKARGKDQEIGRMLLDKKMIGPLTSTERLAKRVAAAKEASGEKIGALYDSAPESAMVDVEAIAKELSSKLGDSKLIIPGNRGVKQQLQENLEDLAANKQLRPRAAQELRQGIDDQVRWGRRNPVANKVQDNLIEQRAALSEKITDAVPGLADENRQFSLLSTADDIADQQVARNAKNRAVSLTDYLAGLAGMANGGPLPAVAIGAANKVARTYGNATMARGFDATANNLQRIGRFGELAKSNPAGFAQVAGRINARMAGEDYQESTPVDPQLFRMIRQDPSLIDKFKDEKLKAQLRREMGRDPAESSSAPQNEQVEPIEQSQERFLKGN